ncbi:hypothetical protein DPMN_001723 [Dreissena polymorpha]|uniref:Uncharacterized protein n=1 Tax=Dreissena polymorpha TaxID=45954 RepID=A0A9D4RR36_DREPO|nr:hypothetical protein DPMN_001723 [Dreissena polymorpha]
MFKLLVAEIPPCHNDGRCNAAVADCPWTQHFIPPCNQSGKLTLPFSVRLWYSVGHESTNQHLARIGNQCKIIAVQNNGCAKHVVSKSYVGIHWLWREQWWPPYLLPTGVSAFRFILNANYFSYRDCWPSNNDWFILLSILNGRNNKSWNNSPFLGFELTEFIN